MKNNTRWLIKCDVRHGQFVLTFGEAWRKRRYPAHFASKLSDSEGEVEETRVWLELAFRCSYIFQEEMKELDCIYDGILAQLVHMIDHKHQWTIRTQREKR